MALCDCPKTGLAPGRGGVGTSEGRLESVCGERCDVVCVRAVRGLLLAQYSTLVDAVYALDVEGVKLLGEGVLFGLVEFGPELEEVGLARGFVSFLEVVVCHGGVLGRE